MNNKGFAITGVLYTIFALFMLILFAALGNASNKRQTMASTIEYMNKDFAMEEIEDKTTTYEIDETNYKATINGKYVFKIRYNTGDVQDLKCTVYLKKGEIIPVKIVKIGETTNFNLIPNDCNRVNNEISLTEITPTNTKMILEAVYKFKESE